jgi:hypothetical protein
LQVAQRANPVDMNHAVIAAAASDSGSR